MYVGQRLVAIVLMLALIGLPGVGRADDDNDNARPSGAAPGGSQGVGGSGNSNENGNDNKDGKRKKDDDKKAPDLKVEYVGWDPKVPELIRFTVTNVGDAASEKTTGRGETIAPPPAQETAPPIPALAPGATHQFSYALFGTTGCDNHTVRASVPLAGDSFPINNTRVTQVCQPKPPPPPPPAEDPIVVGPAPIIVVPEHRRPGEHTHTFTEPLLAWAYDADVVTGDGTCRIAGYYPSALAVGWQQVEIVQVVLGVEVDEDCTAWHESQVGVEFDLSYFDDIPNPSVTRAELRFSERELRWTDADGRRQAKPGCVKYVDIATENWHQPNSSSFPLASEPYRNVPAGTVHRIDVRSATNEQVRNARPRHGFILRGGLGLNQLQGQSDESCVSRVEGLQLEVTYVVP